MNWIESMRPHGWSHRRAICIVVTGLMTLAGGDSVSAANFVGFDPAIHERYSGSVPNPTFLIDESDISGISGAPTASINRGQLISPFHVVTSRHLGAPTVRYRTSAGVYTTYPVATTEFFDLTTDLGGGSTSVSDIRIYRLANPIPVSDGITPIPIFDGGVSDIVGKQIYVTGRNNQAGLNVVRDIVIAETGGGSVSTYSTTHTYDTDPLHPLYDGVGTGEAQIIDGDSGHPTLIQVGDGVGLLGLNLGINPSASEYGGLYTNFNTLLTPYLPQIRAIVENDGYQISTISFASVPEPTGLTILSVVGVCGWMRRRRQSFPRQRHARSLLTLTR